MQIAGIFNKLYWWVYQEETPSENSSSSSSESNSSDVPPTKQEEDCIPSDCSLDNQEISELEHHTNQDAAVFQSKKVKTHEVFLETFGSIRILLKVLDSRPNNDEMFSTNQSQTGRKYFCYTSTYEEAISLLTKGYTEIIDEVNSKVGSKISAYHKDLYKTTIPNSNVVGFVPIVPNAIMGLPNSMVYKTPKINRPKCLHLIYFPIGNWTMDIQEFKEAGVTLLAAIKILEQQGINIRIDVGCIGTEDYRRAYMYGAVVKLKDYHDRLNILKLCFPLAHPSMLRRIGFKWLETVPDLKGRYKDTYGSTRSSETLRKDFNFGNAVIFATEDVIALQYDIEKLINFIKDQCKTLD